MDFSVASACRSLQTIAIAATLACAISCAGSSGVRGETALPHPLAPWTHPAPAFALADSRGVKAPFAANPDGVTLVHFFATWCEPCREELPALRRLQQRAGDKVRVVVISVAEPELRVQRFMAKEFPDAQHTVLIDGDRAVSRAWNVTSLPSTIALDASARPRLAAEAAVAWDEIQPDALRDAIDNAPEQRSKEGGKG